MPTPTIPGLDVPRAKRYSRIKLAALLLNTALSFARLGWFAGSGHSARLRDKTQDVAPDPRLATPAYVAAYGVLSWLAGLPFAYVTGHVVERRFDLTKQGTPAWLRDAAKGLVVTLALEVPAATVSYAVIRRRPRDWWLILAGATVPLLVILGQFAPVLILPLFNKFEPIRDRVLADRVKDLGKRAGVPIADVLRVDMSRQTEKPNAFFAGIGHTKRIVLSDTMLDRFSPSEVDAVVAHELGHQAHGDIWRLTALFAGMGTGSAYAIHRLAPPLFDRAAPRTGVRGLGDVAGFPLFELLGGLLGFVALPLQNAVSRAI
ncbi:MAG: CAAX prenyl protease 1, putative, partial [uncultured Thermomicrobiales bacterium]